MRKVKEINDNSLVELNNKFAMLNLKDRDDVVFNYETDVKKMIRKLNIKRLLKKDKKYLRNVRKIFMAMILQSYLKDMILTGQKKKKRYISYFTEPE